MAINLPNIFQMVLKDGLREYKAKNSRHKNVPLEEQKGAIFGYRNKKNMTSGKGVVLTSLEALEENDRSFSHWTPNVYRYGTYTDKKVRVTVGHSEGNLRQINTFYVDFDIKNRREQISEGDILTTSLDLGFMPTMILRTTNGFQAYFVLESPAYVTASSEFKVINVAKIISQNIREYFKDNDLPVDMTCNHFGIARIPRYDNILYLEESNVYPFAEWLEWSMKQEGSSHSKKPSLTVLSGTEGYKQIDEPWYHLLKNSSKIKGQKGLFGRNNVMFTLALACYSSGVQQSFCIDELLEFNDRLEAPLKKSEINKIVNSAYSGKYEAANRTYIQELCHTWVEPDLKSSDLFLRQAWYKFKKSRDQRQRSHYSEWETDLLNYIGNQTSPSSPYLVTKKKDIMSAIGIPERSLDAVLKKLKIGGKLLINIKRGRNGGIILASVTTLALNLVGMTRQERANYYKGVSELVETNYEHISTTLSECFRELQEAYSGTLFELDTG